MSNYAHRGIVNESASCRLPPGPVDFVAINNSKRRNRRRADRLQFNTLWDKRAGNENSPLCNFLLMFWSLVGRGVGKHRSRSHASRNEDCSAFRYPPLHKQNYTREGTVCKLVKR